MIALFFVALFAFLAFGGFAVLGQYQKKVTDLGQAIAYKGEGFGTVGAIPTLANNPGDLERGDLGQGELQGKTIYPSEQNGWNALYSQIELVRLGLSRHFNRAMTFYEFGHAWVEGPNAPTGQAGRDWANNVSATLGVDPNSTLEEYFSGKVLNAS